MKLWNLLLTEIQVSVMVMCWAFKLHPLPICISAKWYFLSRAITYANTAGLGVSQLLCPQPASNTACFPYVKALVEACVCGREMGKSNFLWRSSDYCYLSLEALESVLQWGLHFSSALLFPTEETIQLSIIREQHHLALGMPASNLCPVLHS